VNRAGASVFPCESARDTVSWELTPRPSPGTGADTLDWAAPRVGTPEVFPSMATQQIAPPREVGRALRIAETLFGAYRDVPMEVRLWDGSSWSPRPGATPRFTLAFRDAATMRRMFLNPSELTLGEAYVSGDFAIEGDLEAAFGLADHLLGRKRPLSEQLALAADLLRLPARSGGDDPHAPRVRGLRHSKSHDREAIQYHYDLSNDFYALWLDKRMVYTCAYFRRTDDDLETAQLQKLDLVCRKLRLRPGQRLLDLGCGWGGLAIHAAHHYGVDATGVTLSRAQVDWACRRIEELGLAETCRVRYQDYRDVDDPEGFDVISCIGMFEHVGEARLAGCLGRVWRLLRPGGAFLLHGITHHAHRPVPRKSFVTRHVFPNGELVPIRTILDAAEEVGFEVRDVENLREHYALTLRHWLRRLDEHRTEALRHVGARALRIWRLYMAGSAYNFSVGSLNLHQSLLLKPRADGNAGLPLTREDWYR
jgi:cyclopropane-fatty-acyl-phospholipid synthase